MGSTEGPLHLLLLNEPSAAPWLIVDSTNAALILSPCRRRSPKFEMNLQLFLM
jgi:hypothetical protein